MFFLNPVEKLMENSLSQLYDAVILKHNSAPFNFEKRLTAQHVVEAYNPLCGDKFKLFLDIEDDTIKKATFHGYGCAISKAATSVLVHQIEGKNKVEAFDILNNYLTALNTEGGHLAGESQSFLAVRQYPERLSCATLSWEAAQTFFENENHKI